jgi:hypothetical protein
MFLKEYKKITKTLSNIDDFAKEQISKGVPDGLFLTPINEPIPTYNLAGCEKVISGKNNSSIVLGRDRESSLISGAGGKGLTKCGMIDMVVGRMSSYTNQKDELLTKEDAVNPSFSTDAARIYMSQRALSVDKYFGIPKSSLGQKEEQKSCVAIKSDHTRILAREKLVLYCGKGQFDGFSKEGELNSLGNGIVLPPRIEFLTGDPELLEPIVKGKKLKEYLENNNKNLSSLANIILDMNIQLGAINAVLSVLTVGAPPFSKHFLDNFTSILETNKVSLNLVKDEINYLDKLLVKGKNSILSDTVFTS